MTMHRLAAGKMGQLDEWAEGVLHFYHDDKGKIVMIPQAAYEKEKNKIPEISFAIKYPIKKIEEKKFPDLAPLMAMLEETKEGVVVHKNVRDDLSLKEIEGPRYFGRPPPSKGSKMFNYCE